MTLILESKKTSFEFHDEDQFGIKEYTIVEVNIQKKKYTNGDIFYHVNYSYHYSDNTEKVKETNPLIDLGDCGEIYDGEIIYANELTESFIKYLMMSYEELKPFTGNTTPQRYKFNIMSAIKLFWD